MICLQMIYSSDAWTHSKVWIRKEANTKHCTRFGFPFTAYIWKNKRKKRPILGHVSQSYGIHRMVQNGQVVRWHRRNSPNPQAMNGWGGFIHRAHCFPPSVPRNLTCFRHSMRRYHGTYVNSAYTGEPWQLPQPVRNGSGSKWSGLSPPVSGFDHVEFHNLFFPSNVFLVVWSSALRSFVQALIIWVWKTPVLAVRRFLQYSSRWSCHQYVPGTRLPIYARSVNSRQTASRRSGGCWSPPWPPASPDTRRSKRASHSPATTTSIVTKNINVKIALSRGTLINTGRTYGIHKHLYI